MATRALCVPVFIPSPRCVDKVVVPIPIPRVRLCVCGRNLVHGFSPPAPSRMERTSSSSSSSSRRATRAIADLMEEWAVAVDHHHHHHSPPQASPLSSLSACREQQHSGIFQRASSEQELLSGIDKEVESGRLPPHAGEGMKELYFNYRNAVLQNESADARNSVIPIMATVLDRILLQFEEPFTFPPYHQSIREPFDYYKFGQEYIRPLLQFSKSYVGNKHHFDAIENHLRQGHNVILFSNHQTEADPAVIALLLETSHPYLAEKMTYIAGDRVVLDPFCKPFSMGRNLICVHSKKHINDEPELMEMKRRANTRALKELAILLRNGQQLIWIAPSGGRDRPDPHTNEWSPAAFDPAAVDNMRRLVERGDVPGHMHPMSLLSYNIMPPPPQVQKEIGEKRLIGYHGVGISVGSEIDFKKENARSVWECVREQYSTLYNAVHGDKGQTASTPVAVLCQPWRR